MTDVVVTELDRAQDALQMGRAHLVERDAAVRDAAVAEANARTEAVRCVLTAVMASTGWRGLDRAKFRRLIAQAGQAVPNTGPAAVQHLVLLTEARRVLGEETVAA